MRFWRADLVKDNYSNSRYEFSLDWRDEFPEGDIGSDYEF